ncbi:MAG: thiosulfate oxidation carrier complex protein SoxZ [Pseudomonadota bacterium]
MATGVKTRVKLPKTVKPGEVVTVKTLITHKMESGHRRGDTGDLIPRSIINRFTADFNGQNIIDIAMEPSISTNPFFQFDAVVPEAGRFDFAWYDEDGSVYTDSKEIAIA